MVSSSVGTVFRWRPDPHNIILKYLFCTNNPAMIPIVVGNDAAQTPSFFNVFSSIPWAVTNGGAHAKQASSPGMIS